MEINHGEGCQYSLSDKEDIGDLIVKVASDFVGMKEKGQNQGFEGPQADYTEQLLLNTGWQKGWPYCAGWAWAVWKLAYGHYKPDLLVDVEKGFSLNSQRILEKFLDKTDWDVSDNFDKMKKGAVIVFGNKKKGVLKTTGHTAIYTGEMENDQWKTIEANTNEMGSREGNGIWRKLRYDNRWRATGLIVLGYVNAKV